MFNGSNISTNEYVDNLTENGMEYCYKVSAVYGTEERFRPDIVFRQISPDFDAEVHIGNHGFRKLTDEKFPEIIFLGDSFTVGPKDAPVPIVEWMDFQCPY